MTPADPEATAAARQVAAELRATLDSIPALTLEQREGFARLLTKTMDDLCLAVVTHTTMIVANSLKLAFLDGGRSFGEYLQTLEAANSAPQGAPPGTQVDTPPTESDHSTHE